MTDLGYIVAGYVVTAAAVASYAWSIRTRTRRVTRTFGSLGLPSAPTNPPDGEG
jgi:hypothetical protein